MRLSKYVFCALMFLLLSPLMFSGCKNEQRMEASDVNQSANSNPSDTGTNDVENKILSIYSHKTDDSKCLVKIMAILPQIDWTKYDKLSNGKAGELLNWLDSMNIKDSKYIEIIADSENGLDGVFAERYAILVGNLFITNKYVFVQAVSGIERDKIEMLCEYIRYYADGTNQKEQIIKEAQELLKKVDNSDGERYFLETLHSMLNP